jgi:hypothetical protein
MREVLLYTHNLGPPLSAKKRGYPQTGSACTTLSHSLSFALSLPHFLTRSLCHSVTRALSLCLSLTRSLCHSLTLSLSLAHSLTLSLAHSLILSLAHSLTFSLTHSLTLSISHFLSQARAAAEKWGIKRLICFGGKQLTKMDRVCTRTRTRPHRIRTRKGTRLR